MKAHDLFHELSFKSYSMRTINFILLLVFFQIITSFNVKGLNLIIKMNTMDCQSCLMSFSQLNHLKKSIKLIILIKEKDETDFADYKLPKILSREYEILRSDSVFNSLPLDRSSYYLFDQNGKLLLFEHLDVLNIADINFSSNRYSASGALNIGKCKSGNKRIAITSNGNLIVHNFSKNSISVISKDTRKTSTLKGSQLDRQTIYKAVHAGDTLNYWNRVVRMESSLKKYGMYNLHFESLTTHGDSCFVLATTYEVQSVKKSGGIDEVFTPYLLIFAFNSSNLYSPQLRAINPLPEKYSNRFALDNTQKVFINENSSNVFIGIYKDDLRGRNPIFASYSMKKGRYYFNTITKQELPKTFKSDKMIYEGNLYEIIDKLLIFLQTGDYIELPNGNKGNLNLGKTILKREANEVKVVYNWSIEGYCNSIFSQHLYVIFFDNGIRKLAIFSVLPKGREILDTFTSEPLKNYVISSNILIDKFGKLIFADENGNILQL